MSSPPRRGPIESVEQLVRRVHKFFEVDVWQADVGIVRSLPYRAARIAHLVVDGLRRNKASDQAAALSFITVLSLVPLLAFVFSFVKGFGAYDHLLSTLVHPFLDNAFGKLEVGPPLVDAAEAIAPSGALEVRGHLENLLEVINQTDFASLGIFGLVVLLVTIIRLLMNIESAMNEIWGVKKGRRMIRRVSDYVAIVVIAPILTITATAVTGAGAERVIQFLGIESSDFDLTRVFFWVVVIAIWGVFILLYLIMPNTRVSLASASIGGLVGGGLFHSVQLLFVWFQSEVTNYSAVYASFAAVPVFLIWVLICWLSVLLGAHVAWAHQAEPRLRYLMRNGPLTPVSRERLVMKLAYAFARPFAAGESLPTVASLSASLSIPEHVIDELLSPLVAERLFTKTLGPEGRGYVPARDLDRIRALDLLDAADRRSPEEQPPGDRVDEVLRELHRAQRESVGNRTLREMTE